MNNKKTFSVNMFLQTYKQLKAIGIAATIIMAVINIFPIIVTAVEIESVRKMYADNPKYLASLTPTVVNVIENHALMCLMFVVFTPIFALNVWKFLNKRNTSDFYHSLPYTRICLFVSRATAVIAWILEIFVFCYIGTALTYLICSKYFIVDYGTLLSLYVTMFFACILVFGAISIACAVTGNAFSNVCVSGLIIFLPRFMIMLVSEAIESMTHIVSADKAISFLNDTQNIVTSFVFGIYSYDFDLQELVLSGQAKIYTTVLALVYLGLAAFLFVKRRSEGAGKSTYGKTTGFIIKLIISMIVTSSATVAAVMSMYIRTESSEAEKYSYIMAVVFMCFISAMAVIIYEFFSNRHFFKFKSCILPTIAGWVVAIVLAFGINVGADAVLAYQPDKEDIEYVVIYKSFDSFGYGDMYKDYFESIEKTTKIDNDAVKQMITQALKDNIDRVKNNKYDEYYYHMGTSYQSDDKESYISYDVYIKDGLFGQYRTIYLTKAQEKLYVDNIQKMQEYKEAYCDLPDYKNVQLEVYADYNLTDDDKKQVYETFLEEIKTLDFKTYYDMIHAEYWGNFCVNMYAVFAKSGIMYSADILLDKEVLPVTFAKYMEVSNKYADEEASELKENVIALMEDFMSGKETDADGKVRDFHVQFEDADGNWGYFHEDDIAESEALKDELIPAVIKNMKAGGKIDSDKKNYMLVEISYEEYKTMEVESITYFVQIDADIDMKEFLSEY